MLIAIETLIKFMKLVLIEIGGNNFKDFSNSIYLIKKTFVLQYSYLLASVETLTLQLVSNVLEPKLLLRTAEVFLV